MKKFVAIVALALMLPAYACAATITLNMADTPGATPADKLRIEEKASTGTWGNIVGTSTATLVNAGTAQFTINNVATGTVRTFRIVPMLNGVDGTPSNACSTGLMPPTDVINLTCTSAQ